MKQFRVVLKNMMCAIGIGSFIYIAMGAFFASDEIRKQILCVLAMSLSIGVFSSVYEIKKLSLLYKGLIQMAGSLLSFLIAAKVGNWFPFEWINILVGSGIFLVIFILIWSGFYFKEKREAKNFNMKLEQWKKVNMK